MKIKFIYNPKAGKRSITKAVGGIIELYSAHGYDVVPYLLSFADDSQQKIVEGLDSGDYAYVLVAGGDGTINYVVTALRRFDVDIPIAVLPAGTANDFGLALGMSSFHLRACRQLLDSTEQRVDLGRVNGRLFVNVFSFGLFTNTSQRTPTKLKNIMGKAAYIFEGISELANIHHLQLDVESDGGAFHGSALMMLVFNGRTAGNFPLAKMSQFDDGVFDVLILRGDSPFSTVDAFVRYIDGIGGINPPDDVVHLRCSRLTIQSDIQEPTDVDGQPGVLFPVQAECLHGGLRIMIPNHPVHHGIVR